MAAATSPQPLPALSVGNKSQGEWKHSKEKWAFREFEENVQPQ